MDGPVQIKVEPEIWCGRCEEISKVEVMEGSEERHFRHHKCPTCGADYEITLEVEWFEEDQRYPLDGDDPTYADGRHA